MTRFLLDMKHLAFTALVTVPMMLFSVAWTMVRLCQGRFFHAGCRICPHA